MTAPRRYIIKPQPGGEWALIDNVTGAVLSWGVSANRKAPPRLVEERQKLEAFESGTGSHGLGHRGGPADHHLSPDDPSGWPATSLPR